MALILLIETSSHNCSVALAENGHIVHSLEEASEAYVHAEKFHPFVKSLFDQSGRSITDVDAFAVSKGPGSYTGLRIGVSAAKGFCFGLDRPLIGIDTTLLLAAHGIAHFPDFDFVRPMIDARRMEVYTALYDAALNVKEAVSARILDQEFFPENDKVLYVGDGAGKSEAFSLGNGSVFQCLPSAPMMAGIADSKFHRQEFEDLAYFEPFYLKDFIPGIPRQIPL